MRSQVPQRRLFVRRCSLRRSGAELLELGLVLGLILLPIMFGTIEFGTYFYVEHNLQTAAREGARAACVFDNEAERDVAARDAVSAVLSQSSLASWPDFLNNYAVDVRNDPTDSNYFFVDVNVTWDHIPEGMRPMLMIRNPGSTYLRGKVTMRIEKAES